MALEEAEHEVGALQAAPRGTLRVSAPVEFGIAFLGGILPEFLARFPDVNVEVDLSSRLVDLGSCPGAWCKSVALYAAPGG